MFGLPKRMHLVIAVASLLVLPLAGCGGGDSEPAAAPEPTTEAVETESTETEQAETEEVETEVAESEEAASDDSASSGGPAPAPGSGQLELDDGRAFAIAVSECKFQPGGTFTVKGTTDSGETFEMTQFFLDGDWSQTNVQIESANGDSIYVIRSRATEGAAPATVDGKSVSWTEEFRELDESANAHVYTGEGTLRLTCR
jgi:hypothetical protein